MVLDNSDRKNIVLSGLANGPGVHLFVDSRADNVVLPEKWMGQPKVIIEVGLHMPNPIPDLVVDEVGVRATLHFAELGEFACFLPWASIYGVHGVFALPLGDAPPEADGPEPPKPERPKLALVE